jgi:hypothetical protein
VKARTENATRIIILIEHGIGLTFGKAAYADGVGQRNLFDLLPVPNQHTSDKVSPEMLKPHPVIGMPKMDKYFGQNYILNTETPTIGIAFHHGDQNSVPPEVGSAWEYWLPLLPALAKKYNILGHYHPLSNPALLDEYKKLGIRTTSNFNDIMEQADIYLNDCSSTMYEFLVTGKPVVILNAPWFRKHVNYGIRFWEYTDIGPMVDSERHLERGIESLLIDPALYSKQRTKAVADLFPYLGNSTTKCINEIRDFVNKQPSNRFVSASGNIIKPEIQNKVVVRESKDRGIIYMCFGDKALQEFEHSVLSLRKVKCDLPVAVVGNIGAGKIPQSIKDGTIMIPWKGENPFQSDRTNNFKFLAGRVKPFLHTVSPFEQTMYIDCDTEFLHNPEPAFDLLKHWDFLCTQERLFVSQLYNRPRAGWFHNYEERDQTILELGANGDFPFWNSGVFFFRKNENTANLFKFWYTEWRRWELWDEQLALMRAANRSNARIFPLPEIWNYPHDDNPKAIIYHWYGRGTARTNV